MDSRFHGNDGESGNDGDVSEEKMDSAPLKGASLRGNDGESGNHSAPLKGASLRGNDEQSGNAEKLRIQLTVIPAKAGIQSPMVNSKRAERQTLTVTPAQAGVHPAETRQCPTCV